MLGALCGIESEAAMLTDLDMVVACGLSQLWKLQKAILRGDVTFLMSWGTCGALSPTLKVGDIVIGTSIISDNGKAPSIRTRYAVDQEWNVRLPKIKADGLTSTVYQYPVLSLGADAVANTPEQRAAYFKQYGAWVLDQESEALAELAATYKLPFVVVRSVSDSVSEIVPPAAIDNLNRNGSINMWGMFTSILKNPSQIVDLMKLSGGYDAALNSLRNFWEVGKGELLSGG